MIIDKLESYTLHIHQINHYFRRRQLCKLLNQLNTHIHFNFEFSKVKHVYILRVHLPKKALPYLISFLSFHNYLFRDIVLTKYEHLLSFEPIHTAIDKHFEMTIDGLSDLFIKDKVIDILNGFKGKEIQYSLSHHALKVTTSPEIFMDLVQSLAICHVDIYQVGSPLRSYNKHSLSS
ncbi:hypothetical protein [Staphylococcus felis]|uniref:hypothetical protein n=1 Tax=Staphylococcus felis TaxID=46127 RepID=UPI003966B044